MLFIIISPAISLADCNNSILLLIPKVRRGEIDPETLLPQIFKNSFLAKRAKKSNL